MSNAIRIRIVPGEARRKLGDAGAITRRQLAQLVTEIAVIAEAEVTVRTPVGWSGNARGGWNHETQNAGTSRPRGVVTNPILYIEALDKGRSAGRMPPVAALIPWVGSKLGIPNGPQRRSVAFLVARKIGARGTEGADMIEQGWAATRPKIEARLKEMGLEIVREIEGS